MIKFFRKIRQQLLIENKTSKYFKYAIGEIVLVVIGILIALQINNWNEKEKGDRLARTYAKGLVRDLKQDTIKLKRTIQFQEEKNLGLNTLIKLNNKDVNKPSINDSIYILFMQNCLNISDFKANQNTLTQLKNTGDLVL